MEMKVEQCHSCSAHSFPLYGVVNQSNVLTFFCVDNKEDTNEFNHVFSSLLPEIYY